MTRGIQIGKGYPELETPLPKRGLGRNHDPVLKGEKGNIKGTICIEAKVDELFGDNTVEEYWKAAIKKRDNLTNPVPTRVPERIEVLLRLVFGSGAVPDQPPWGTIRYQLLAGIAGTILQAIKDGSFFAIFVVHEFHTLDVNSQRVEKNAADFEHVVRTVKMVPNLAVETGKLYGPIRIHPKPFANKDVELFIGKCIDKWHYPHRT